MYQPVQTQIDKIATSLQNSNNLDHVLFKGKVWTRSICREYYEDCCYIWCCPSKPYILLYTIVHLSYFAIRYFAFGAHAKSTFMYHSKPNNVCDYTANCHQYKRTVLDIFDISAHRYIIIMKYAPMETKKHPLLGKWKKGLKLRSIIAATILIIISLFVKEPYQQLICLGLIFESVSLLPIFYKKEETIS